jgi:Family of unknown function (DUF5824)
MQRGPRHIVVRGRSWPERYFTGLTRTQKLGREKELLTRRRVDHPKMGPSDRYATRKKSRWTQLFHNTYPGLKFDKDAIARKTGISRSVLNTVYNRGLKAWKTGGSRVGATPYQWAVARVYKFVLVSKKKAQNTKYDPDQDLRSPRSAAAGYRSSSRVSRAADSARTRQSYRRRVA